MISQPSPPGRDRGRAWWTYVEPWLFAGWTAQVWGYGAIPIAGAVCIGGALLLTAADPTWQRQPSPAAVPAPDG